MKKKFSKERVQLMMDVAELAGFIQGLNCCNKNVNSKKSDEVLNQVLDIISA